VLNDVGTVIPKASMERIGAYVGRDPRFASLAEAEQYVRLVSTPFGPLSDAQWKHLTEHNSKQHEDGSWGMNYDPGVALPFRKVQAKDIVLWDYFDAVKCPTLLLRGAQSDLLPREIAVEMTARGPKPELVEFAGIGHAPMLMAEDQIAAVSRFLV
jgi:pimeloyl-ACP methyl ester carboxylesterase